MNPILIPEERRIVPAGGGTIPGCYIDEDYSDNHAVPAELVNNGLAGPTGGRLLTNADSQYLAGQAAAPWWPIYSPYHNASIVGGDFDYQAKAGTQRTGSRNPFESFYLTMQSTNPTFVYWQIGLYGYGTARTLRLIRQFVEIDSYNLPSIYDSLTDIILKVCRRENILYWQLCYSSGLAIVTRSYNMGGSYPLYRFVTMPSKYFYPSGPIPYLEILQLYDGGYLFPSGL